MKRISFSGTFTVSDKVFEYLQSAEHLAGVDQVGMYRTNDTFLYFIHDALEEWVTMQSRGLLDDSSDLCKTLAETNKLLATLINSRTTLQASPVLVSEKPQEPESQPSTEPTSAPEPKPEQQEPKQPARQISPEDIRARLSGFIRT